LHTYQEVKSFIITLNIINIFSIFKAEGRNMTEKAVLTIRLVPEAVKVKASLIKQDIQKEFENIVRAIPWAAEIVDIQVE